jgi:hypothetical protein
MRLGSSPRALATRAAVVVVFFGLLISAVAVGQVRGSSTAFIPVSEIRPGMRGYGLTVFRGTRPERFDVEVIDVLHNFRPDQDLILIRAEHPILEQAHVVAGMSGSPIYLDGDRLAGAYAYGWPYSTEAVAGVTPIANMVSEMRRPVRPDSFPGAQPIATPGRRRPRAPSARAPRVRAGGLRGGLPSYLGDELASATTALDLHADRLGLDRPRSSATLAPAATPLLVGGLDDATVQMLDTQLGRFGLMVLQAGGGGQVTPPPDAPTAFAHGSSVGVQLVRGDISATAVGTVTHVDGGRAAAFGHPMLNAGETGLPTAVTRVLHILSSEARSFKIAEPVRSLGTLVQDRQSGIVVDERLEPARVAARVRILGVEGAPRTEWNVETASHRVLTPVLLTAAINNAVSATAADNTDVMFEATSRVWIAGRTEPVSVVDHGYSHVGASNPLALGQLRLFSLLEAIYGNPFEETRASRVEVDLDVRFARETLQILDASTAGREVDPGSTVPVRVVLRRWGQPEEVRLVEVAIPERLAGEDVEIFIQGGGSVRPDVPIARSLDDILDTVRTRYSHTAMMVSLETQARGLRFGGHVVRHLPASALDALQLQNDGDRNRPFVTYDRHVHELGSVVSGTARIELHVRRTRRP